MTRRVVVTGLGLVSSLGLGTSPTWRGLVEGLDGLRPVSGRSFRPEGPQVAAEVLDLPERPKTSTTEVMALLALEEALAQAGPSLGSQDPDRVGVFQGAGTTGIPEATDFLRAQLRGSRCSPVPTLRDRPGALTDCLAWHLGATGPRTTLMSACASSLISLGQAWERVAGGELDLAAAGGAEGLSALTYAGFSSLKAMDPTPCRPFSCDRSGMNLGEGAAEFLLEPLERALERGAPILAEVLGYGVSQDAHHPTAPDPTGDGAARAIRMALQVARVDPDQVDLVSAHATATPANDVAEALAIRSALGRAADEVAITATKSQFGHCLGAAGGMAAAVTVLSLLHQVVTPTLRLVDQDPACDLDCTPLVPRPRRIRVALVNALAFGGTNVCLVLRRWEGP